MTKDEELYSLANESFNIIALDLGTKYPSAPIEVIEFASRFICAHALLKDDLPVEDIVKVALKAYK